MKLIDDNPTTAYGAGTLLVRLIVGPVFLVGGLQKLIYATIRGAGRFESIAFPNPEFCGRCTHRPTLSGLTQQ